MKKIVLLAIISVFSISVASAAGPFGLEMGMSLQQVKNACGGTEARLIDDDRYYVEPLQKHSAFEGYIILEYEFSNNAAIEAKKKQQEDSVF